MLIQGCKKDAANALPKVTITSPVQNPHQKYKDKQLLHFIFNAYDVDGLAGVQASIKGAGRTFLELDTTLNAQGEFPLDIPFIIDSVYGRDSMKCAAVVTATDTKGGASTMKLYFEVYRH